MAFFGFGKKKDKAAAAPAKLSVTPALVEKKGESTLLAAVRRAEAKHTFDASRVVKVPLTLPTAGHETKIAFVLLNVYTDAECKALIAATEKLGYAAALINVGGGRQQLMTDVRNNDRCMVDDNAFADHLYDRIKSYVPPTFKHCDAVSLNERLRFLRYDPGQQFAEHYDGVFMRDNGERSYVTVQLYLNEGFEGGATTFLEEGWHAGNGTTDCVPKTGSVLIFEHHLLHKGSALIKGRKYCLRTDVMYDMLAKGGKRRVHASDDTGVSQDVPATPALAPEATPAGLPVPDIPASPAREDDDDAAAMM